MAKTIILSRSIGMTVSEARETLKNLGIIGIELRSSGRGTPRTPRVRRLPIVDTRGSRFVRAERLAVLS